MSYQQNQKTMKNSVKRFFSEQWPVFAIIISFVLFTVLLAYCAARRRGEKKEYCGSVVSTGYDAPTSGYKTHTDPCYFVILRVDSINTCIRINVITPTYYEAQTPGKRMCFSLDKVDLDNYGNGNKHLIK